MKTTTASTVVTLCRDIFARFGMPQFLVSDNGPQFTSEEFEAFCYNNGISHRLVAIYHPKSNGQAEVAVKHFKRSMKKISRSDSSLALVRFLFAHRTTPHTSTGQTPAFLMFNRELQTHLSKIIPSTRRKVETSQSRQTRSRTKREHHRTFQTGGSVLCRIGSNWQQGIVTKKITGLTYWIKLTTGRMVKAHIDNIKESAAPPEGSDIAPWVDPRLLDQDGTNGTKEPTVSSPKPSPVLDRGMGPKTHTPSQNPTTRRSERNIGKRITYSQ
jgi:hypothetical protein